MRTWCNYTERIDTYKCGCQHNCSYCYAKSLLSFRGFWGKPKKESILEIKNKLKALDHKVVRLGGMTDCFQPIELTERNTYNTILWLNRYKIHYLIVTKSALVSSDDYLKIYDKDLAHFQISVTSEFIANEYENASTFSDRVKSIETLYESGFDVSVRLSPLIDEFMDYNAINSIKCNKILIEFLKVNHWIRKWFPIDYTDYSLNYCNYDHLQLERKIELAGKVNFNQVSVGEYVYDHYLYFRENLNHNKQDCCNLTLNKIPELEQLTLFK